MNLLTVVQTHCRRTGIPVPTSVAGSVDSQVVQLLALVNEAVEDIWTRWDWQLLVKEVTFTTAATEDQGSFPTICGVAKDDIKRVLQETIWNRTLRLPVYGPLAASQWQALKAQPSAGPFYKYRIRGNRLLFDPAPPAGHTCAFEILTGLAVETNDGLTLRSSFLSDTDEFRLDYKLLLAAIRWKWKAEKGLDYAEDFTRYELMGADMAAVDGTKPTLSMDGEPSDFRPGIFVPAGNWNLP